MNAPAAGLVNAGKDEIHPRGITLRIPICGLRSPRIESTDLMMCQHVLKARLIAGTGPLSRSDVIGDTYKWGCQMEVRIEVPSHI